MVLLQASVANRAFPTPTARQSPAQLSSSIATKASIVVLLQVSAVHRASPTPTALASSVQHVLEKHHLVLAVQSVELNLSQ